jgi:ABC-type glycerol-3-phosphate transport system permease component
VVPILIAMIQMGWANSHRALILPTIATPSASTSSAGFS